VELGFGLDRRGRASFTDGCSTDAGSRHFGEWTVIA
jgi:hypothetical protein